MRRGGTWGWRAICLWVLGRPVYCRERWVGALLLAVAFSLNAAGEESGKSGALVRLEGTGAPESSIATLDEARAWHDAGILGDDDAVLKAEKAFRQWLAKEPTNAIARVFLGSTLTLRARDVRFPTTKLRYAREGLAEMDRAVELAPEDVTVRFARAANNSELPSMLKREAIAVADAAWLWKRVRQDTDQKEESGSDTVVAGEARLERAEGAVLVYGVEFRQQVGLLYGRLLERRKDYEGAMAVWTESLEWDKKSDAGEELQRLLESVRRRGRRGG